MTYQTLSYFIKLLLNNTFLVKGCVEVLSDESSVFVGSGQNPGKPVTLYEYQAAGTLQAKHEFDNEVKNSQGTDVVCGIVWM